MKKFLEYLTKAPVYLIVFFLPLFFAPFSLEIFEFNKLYLLFGFILVSMLGWFGRLIFVERSLSFRRTPLDIPVGVLFASALVATVFSRDVVSSFMGFYGRFSGSFTELILWIIFYFVITNNFTYREAKQLFLFFFASASLVAIFFYLASLGLLKSITIFSSLVTSPLGISPQQLAIFETLALLFLILYGILFLKKELYALILWILGSFLLLSTLIVINFQGSWWILAISLAFFCFWVLRKRLFSPAEINRLSIAIFLVLFSIVFLVFPNVLKFFNVPAEIMLNQDASWKIAYNTLTSFPSAFVGVGPANFFTGYNLFRPASFNQAPEWSLRFDTALPQYANIIVTMGAVGIVGFALCIIFIGYLLRTLWKTVKEKEITRESAFYGCGFLGVILSLLFYYQTAGLSLIFWMTLAPLAILLGHTFSFKEYRYDFSLSPEANLFLTSVFFVGLFVIALLGYFAGQFYWAEAKYKQGITSSDESKRIQYLTDAVKLNSFRIEYRIALANAMLGKISNDIQKTGPDNIKDITPLADLAARTINEANQIVQIAPKSVVSWENRALVYRDLRNLVAGDAARFSIEAFQKAATFEPVDPVFSTQIALLSLEKGDLKEAENFIKKSESLKPDYANNQVTKALLLEKQGKLSEAAVLLDKVLQTPNLPAGLVIDTLFQLGRISYNANDYQKAKEVLEKVVEFNPNHSNAHLALGLTYEKIGETSKARTEYKKVLDLNPGNKEVMKRLEGL